MYPVQLLTNDKSGSAGRAQWYWIDKNNLPKGQEYLSQFKVVTTSAYPKKSFVSGEASIGNIKQRVKDLTELLPNNSAFGRSRLALFMSDSECECRNFLKYTQTNFFCALLLQEPNRSSSFGFVIPDQDFSDNSDIDWSRTTSEIDAQLFSKYNLNQNEIAFLEGVN